MPKPVPKSSRIISTGVGHRDIAGDDRAHLVRLVSAKTGLSPADAEPRTGEVIGQAKEASWVRAENEHALICRFIVTIWPCSRPPSVAVSVMVAYSD
jgi:hypothetical protein